MLWTVLFHKAFDDEFEALSEPVQDELLATIRHIALYGGPTLGRPHVDTLVGSRHANMKEMRFAADGGVWRAAFAFDPVRRVIVLVCGNKAGKASQRFYKALIKVADQRFDDHLKVVKKEGLL